VGSELKSATPYETRDCASNKLAPEEGGDAIVVAVEHCEISKLAWFDAAYNRKGMGRTLKPGP
ncbi:uncharacterized protein METZ01_LOCUS486166, partial [marine metagenome]